MYAILRRRAAHGGSEQPDCASERSTSEKKTGVSTTPKSVTPIMPPSTATPDAPCPHFDAPAPVAIASGSTPSMNATEVIMIGR